MAVMDDIADELAIKALDLEKRTKDEGLVRKIADALATSSPTMEETFLTAVRIRRAERRARAMIDAMEKGEAPPKPDIVVLPPQPDDH